MVRMNDETYALLSASLDSIQNTLFKLVNEDDASDMMIEGLRRYTRENYTNSRDGSPVNLDE